MFNDSGIRMDGHLRSIAASTMYNLNNSRFNLNGGKRGLKLMQSVFALFSETIGLGG